MFASSPPIAFWRRNLIWREGACYRRRDFGLEGMSPPSPCEPDNLDQPAFRAAIRKDPGLVQYLRWSILPQVAVQRETCALRVIVGDARYGSGANSRLSHQTLLPTGGPGCPA